MNRLIVAIALGVALPAVAQAQSPPTAPAKPGCCADMKEKCACCKDMASMSGAGHQGGAGRSGQGQHDGHAGHDAPDGKPAPADSQHNHQH